MLVAFCSFANVPKIPENGPEHIFVIHRFSNVVVATEVGTGASYVY